MRISVHTIEISISHTLGIHSSLTDFHFFPLFFNVTTTGLVMKNLKGQKQAKRETGKAKQLQSGGLAGTDDIIDLLK